MGFICPYHMKVLKNLVKMCKKKKEVPAMISPLPFDLLQILRKEECTVLFLKDIQSGNKMRC